MSCIGESAFPTPSSSQLLTSMPSIVGVDNCTLNHGGESSWYMKYETKVRKLKEVRKQEKGASQCLAAY